MKHLLIIAGLVCSSALSGWAQDTYNVSDGQEQHIFVYDFIAYLEDPTDSLTFDDVRKPNYAERFQTSTDFAPRNYVLGSTYWIKVKIGHHSESENEWLLEFFDQTIDRITAYIPDTTGGYEKKVLGDLLEFQEREVAHKNFIIPINNDHEQELTYYFRIEAEHPIDLLLVLRSYNYFTYYSLNEYWLFGLFYGLLTLIALYNLVLFVAIREKSYLFFVLYAASIALYFSSSDGFAYQYVWPHGPHWNQIAYGVFNYLTVLWAVLFTLSFLHLKSKAPRVRNILTLLLVLRTGFFALCLLYQPVWFDYLAVDWIALLVLLTIAVFFFRSGYQPARLFLLAFIFLFLGAIIKTLLITGISNLSSNVANYYSFHLAFLLQLITFSFALADKVRIIRKNRDLALKRMVKQLEINGKLQTKVNRELEQKVTERTVELKSANLKLQEQAEEIKKINQLLDKNNWNLRKASATELRKRLLSKGISYPEFHKLFPDEVSCLQYLAELKWSSGFCCRKCSNTSASPQKQFGKRCTKCGYVESVTSHTVFHNLRFPLSKAFYLAHVEISGLKVTGKELAEMLSLRPATISSFRKKVREALAHPGETSLGEESLILQFPLS